MKMGLTGMVAVEIESFLADVLAWMDTGSEEELGRGVGAGGWGGSDQAKGQSERGEDGQEVHLA